MLIAARGAVAGSLSGSCLEDEVIERAQTVLRTGTPDRVVFDTRRRFGCNGALDILIEKASDDLLGKLAANFHTRQPTYIATGWTEGRSRIIGTFEAKPTADFVQIIFPSPQILVIGEGPDSLTISTIAHALGWATHHLNSADQLAASYDEWTAAIVKTHNYGRDFAALRTLLPMNLRYIGLMGSRARREQLLGDLLDTGVVPGSSLFAPAGLDLGGESPEAIALAIIAEMQAVFSGGSGNPLRQRKSPIHQCEAESELAKFP